MDCVMLESTHCIKSCWTNPSVVLAVHGSSLHARSAS